MESPNSSPLAVKKEVHRPLANFPETVWKDPLTSFSISDPASDVYKQKQDVLKEEVKEVLMASKANPIENIKFIDALCRLGVSYNFESEIGEQLERIFGSPDFNDVIRGAECDLYTVGLVFQVFRQFGYKMSSDVFDKFKSQDGKFKKHLGADARGMLSLYEAAQWSTPGEDILDEALAFSRSHLEELVSRSSPHLAIRIKNALKHSYHKGIPRVEARQYISYYEEEESHHKTLLEFAKVDFNLLQQFHREELGHVSRWFKSLDIPSKFPYTRNRVVEIYLWAVAAYFEPKYSQARIILAKFIIIESILDDIYDAYGTMEELDLFTDAIARWHPSAMDGLPDYMKYFYRIILDFSDEHEQEIVQEGRRSECLSHAKDALILLAKSYHQEAKWLHKNYVATFDEYMENGKFSVGHHSTTAAAFLGMVDEATVSAFEWLSTMPKLMTASAIVCRFRDDLTSHEFEHKRKHVSTAIDCYMKQYGVSKDKAVEEIRKIITDSWKDVNEEFMRPHQVSFSLLMRVINLTRIMEVFYKYQDEYTNSEFMKDRVVSLFREKIPI